MIPPTVDIAFVMTGDVHRNARALRQLGALANAGLTVKLLALPPTTIRTTLPAAVDPAYVPMPPGRGPRHFLAVHRAFAHALADVPARVYHASDLYVLRAVQTAAGRRRVPFTYDARELYAHVAATEGRPLVSRFWRWFEAAPARRAAAVWTVSDAIADRLTEMHGMRRPQVQFNAPPAEPVTPDPHLRSVTGVPPATPLFVHVGQMRRGRGGAALVHGLASVDGVAVVFLGYGPERAALERLTADLGVCDRVFFVDPVPPERVRAVTAGADVGVTLLEDTCLNHRFALPNKLFDYLAAGIPVLGSRLPEIERVVDRFDVGVTVDPTDIDAIAAALRRMADDAASRARWSLNTRSAAETFDWHRASERFVVVYQNLLADRSAPEDLGT